MKTKFHASNPDNITQLDPKKEKKVRQSVSTLLSTTEPCSVMLSGQKWFKALAIPEICHFFDTSRFSTDTKNTLIPDFLTPKNTKFMIFTLKHTNSHSFYTGLKILTPAPQVVLVTNFKYEPSYTF